MHLFRWFVVLLGLLAFCLLFGCVALAGVWVCCGWVGGWFELYCGFGLSWFGCFGLCLLVVYCGWIVLVGGLFLRLVVLGGVFVVGGSGYGVLAVCWVWLCMAWLLWFVDCFLLALICGLALTTIWFRLLGVGF